jgi:hypothetical protein
VLFKLNDVNDRVTSMEGVFAYRRIVVVSVRKLFREVQLVSIHLSHTCKDLVTSGHTSFRYEAFALCVVLRARREHGLTSSKVHAHRFVVSTRVSTIVVWAFLPFNRHYFFFKFRFLLN